jgi:hypothetical protein
VRNRPPDFDDTFVAPFDHDDDDDGDDDEKLIYVGNLPRGCTPNELARYIKGYLHLTVKLCHAASRDRRLTDRIASNFGRAVSRDIISLLV